MIDFSTFSRDREGLTGEVVDAFSVWGFAVLTGHGIPREKVDKMFALVSQCPLCFRLIV